MISCLSGLAVSLTQGEWRLNRLRFFKHGGRMHVGSPCEPGCVRIPHAAPRPSVLGLLPRPLRRGPPLPWAPPVPSDPPRVGRSLLPRFSCRSGAFQRKRKVTELRAQAQGEAALGLAHFPWFTGSVLHLETGRTWF